MTSLTLTIQTRSSPGPAVMSVMDADGQRVPTASVCLNVGCKFFCRNRKNRRALVCLLLPPPTARKEDEGMYQPQGECSMQHQPVLEAVRATRLSLFRYSFCLLFPLVLCFQRASAGDPIPIEYDPKHPGYYKPFRCLSVDTNIRGQWGGIKNRCGFEVEAYWYSTNGANQWSIPANGVHPLFVETDPDVLGCRVNESLDRSLGLCKDHRAVAKAASEADRLAKDLGITPNEPVSTAQSASGQDDAARLAEQLGMSTSAGSAAEGLGDYDASQLQNDLLVWEDQERVRQEEAARLARIEMKRQMIEAAERARREAIEEEQREAERERQALAEAEAEEDEGPGFLSTLLTTAATVYVQQKTGILPLPDYSGPRGSGGTSASAPGGEDCRRDTAMLSRAEEILRNCPEPGGICASARADASCFGQVASVYASCPSARDQALDLQRQYEAQARAACANP